DCLMNWIEAAVLNDRGQLPLTIVVGERGGNHRTSRRESERGKMIAAGKSDLAAGKRAAQALACRLKTPLHLHNVTDENGADRFIDRTHLIVMGSPEVNACATFLHGLVQGFHYGERDWPPDLGHAADLFTLQDRRYLRAPRGSEVNHCGGVFL